MSIRTIGDALDHARHCLDGHGLGPVETECEWLVGSLTALDRTNLYLQRHQPISAHTVGQLEALLKRRIAREPLQYLVQEVSFRGHALTVGPGVLIPRPETEQVVDQALAGIPMEATWQVLDIGTGSGAIAVALACERPGLVIDAVEISVAATHLAARNFARHGLAGRVHLIEADFRTVSGVYDLIISNPPYIKTADIPELEPEVRLHEPWTALDGGMDGLECYRAIIAYCGTHLRVNGRLVLELGADTAAGVHELVKKTCFFEDIVVKPDYNNIERVLTARKVKHG